MSSYHLVLSIDMGDLGILYITSMTSAVDIHAGIYYTMYSTLCKNVYKSYTFLHNPNLRNFF